MGALIELKTSCGNFDINLSNHTKGLYILVVDEKISKKIIKE